MNIYAFGPIAAVLDGAYAVVNAIITAIEPFAGAASAALAIVLVTLVVRAVLIPVGVSQARAQQTRARLAPMLAELQKRHKRDPETLQRKTMELYAAENASPFAGCLPLLAQAPVLSLVYALFVLPVIAGHDNALLGHELFGVPLGTSLAHALGSADAAALPVFGVLLALIAAIAWASRRFLAIPQAPAQPGASSALTRALGFAPFLTVVFAAFVPLAAGVYLLTTTTWTLAERLVLRARFAPPAASPRPA